VPVLPSPTSFVLLSRVAIISCIFLCPVCAQVKQQKPVSQTEQLQQLDLSSGHPSCPCITDTELLPPLDFRDYTSPEAFSTLGLYVNDTSYGISCGAHDIPTPQCSPEKQADCNQRRNRIPETLSCDLSWCQRSWCYVDPTNCTLNKRRHPSFPTSDRFYSYATCGDMDANTNNRRFASLEGQVFKMGLNANTGGWLGSYHSDGTHFQGPIDQWTGQALDFVIKAAYRGKFFLELDAPPAFLQQPSEQFYGSDSKFDLCVYATALGYLDICVAQYTITDSRASSTDWIVLGSTGIYLVVDAEEAAISKVEYFWKSVTTIFQPFTWGTWAFIVFFVIPVLGCLMVIHERGKGGSTYPTEEAVVVLDDKKGESYLKKRRIPIRRSIIKSIYIAFLSVLQQNYEQSVLTLGAMLNLLGISFFILTIIAVYTANLAAILTQNMQQVSIDSFEDAVRAGYRFCSERKNMETIRNLYPHLDQKIFVADPPDIGGDGQPGFTCQYCDSRMRVFDFLDPVLAEYDSRYCHAAVAPLEDLEVVHAAAIHCNKTSVGKPIQMIQTGIPVFETVSPQLISFFLKLKNDGLYDEMLVANKPENQCAQQSNSDGEEGSALNLAQLSGIWVVSFAFALAGLIATCAQGMHKKHSNQHNQIRTMRVHKRDQKGDRIDALGIEDSWMTSTATNKDTSIAGSVRRGLVHEGSRAGSIRLMQSNDEQDDGPDTTADTKDVLMQWIRKRSAQSRRSPKENFGDATGRSNRTSPTAPAHPESISSDEPVFGDATAHKLMSVGESRRKLRDFIDEQAKKQEGILEPRTRGNSDDDGSFNLQLALDELSFAPSFSRSYDCGA